MPQKDPTPTVVMGYLLVFRAASELLTDRCLVHTDSGSSWSIYQLKTRFSGVILGDTRLQRISAQFN